jgi:hypothetical protein
MLRIFLAVTLLSSLFACSHDSASIHTITNDGASMVSTTTKKTEYPADAPIYNATTTGGMNSPDNHVRVVVLETSDPMDKISSFYQSQFDEKGWRVDATMKTDKMVMYKAAKDNRVMVVTIGSDGGKQKISQTLGDK